MISEFCRDALMRALGPFTNDEAKRSQFNELFAGAEAEPIVQWLGEQGLLAYAGRELERLGVAAEFVTRRARAVAQRNAIRAQRQLQVLARLAHVANDRDIPLLILRTPYLVELLYHGDYGLRAFSDIDVAVKPQHLTPFVQAMAQELPSLVLRTDDEALAQRKAALGSRMELTLDAVAIDLHWELSLHYNFDRAGRAARRQQEIWANASVGEYLWGRCLVMADQDLALHLAEHCVIQHDLARFPYLQLLEFARLVQRLEAHTTPTRLLHRATRRRTAPALTAACTAAIAVFRAEDEHSLVASIAAEASPCVTRAISAGLATSASHAFRDELLTTATFIGATRTRIALLANLLFPWPSLVSYTLNRTVSGPGYLGVLAALPLRLSLIARVAATLATRQAEDLRAALHTWCREAFVSLCGFALATRYYAAYPRHTGLVGLGAATVWRERLGFVHRPRVPDPLWLHVAGPGDAEAARLFLMAHGHADCVLTYGSIEAQSVLQHAHGDSISSYWLPFDRPSATRRFLKRVRPRAFVNMQCELWPILLRELSRKEIPIVFLRADLPDWSSQREFPRWVRPHYERLLRTIDRFSAKNERQLQRLRDAGIPAQRIVLGGDYRIEAAAAFLAPPTSKSNANVPRMVWAGPRSDEVASILPLWRERILRGKLNLVIAPIGVEECNQQIALCNQLGLPIVRAARSPHAVADSQVLVLDTFGLLRQHYASAQLALIGDSFPPTFSEGRNPWEALAMGLPVMYGPAMMQSKALRHMEAIGAAFRLSRPEEILDAMRLAACTDAACIRQAVRLLAAQVGNASTTDVQAVAQILDQKSPSLYAGAEDRAAHRSADLRRLIRVLSRSATIRDRCTGSRRVLRRT